MSGALLTAGDVADLLGVPKSWVYEQSRAGGIPTVTLGHYRRYRREAIEAEMTGMIEPRPELARTASTLVVADRLAPRDTGRASDR
jgi:excisionase family DNA binding protein